MSGILSDHSVRILTAGDCEAVFLPRHGMLGASLRHRGVEILRRIDDLDAAAANRATAGNPLLHPWANRIAGLQYRAGGRTVTLDAASPLLHLDANGLPIHGVPWALLAWTVTDATDASLTAILDWTRDDLLAIFPFAHKLEIRATLDAGGLTMATTLVAGADAAVPVSFGFHPYIGLPDLPRDEWTLALPPMRKLARDARGIPTGDDSAYAGLEAPLEGLVFDDGFELPDERASLSIRGGGRRVSVDWLEGYRYAQVYTPQGGSFIALEPMTAPTNALVSGRGLRAVPPGDRFRAVFRIGVEAHTS